MQALSTAATGLSAQQQRIDIIANNLANIKHTQPIIKAAAPDSGHFYTSWKIGTVCRSAQTAERDRHPIVFDGRRFFSGRRATHRECDGPCHPRGRLFRLMNEDGECLHEGRLFTVRWRPTALTWWMARILCLDEKTTGFPFRRMRPISS
jgi:hypothetical protein